MNTAQLDSLEAITASLDEARAVFTADLGKSYTLTGEQLRVLFDTTAKAATLAERLDERLKQAEARSAFFQDWVMSLLGHRDEVPAEETPAYTA